MGHSSINVSLTYLRGLEIAELKEEDMPNIKTPAKSKGFYICSYGYLTALNSILIGTGIS